MKIIIIADEQTKLFGEKPSKFEKLINKIVAGRKCPSLPGCSFTTSQGEVLDLIAKHYMDDDNYKKFSLIIKSRIEKPFEPTYCGPEPLPNI